MESTDPRWPIIVLADNVYVYTSSKDLIDVLDNVPVSETYDAEGYCVALSVVEVAKGGWLLPSAGIEVKATRVHPLVNRADRLRERLMEDLADIGIPQEALASDSLCQLVLRQICGR